jgi:hypothetical protein
MSGGFKLVRFGLIGLLASLALAACSTAGRPVVQGSAPTQATTSGFVPFNGVPAF